MRNTFRTLISALGLCLAGGLAAQIPYTVVVQGQVADCTPGTPVVLHTGPNTLPSWSITVTTDSSCHFQGAFDLSSATGSVVAITSCGNGTSIADSVFYSFSTPQGATTLAMSLICGNPPGGCQAAFTVQQAVGGGVLTPWQVTTNNLSTGNGSLHYQWRMPDSSISTDENPTWTFNAPGIYAFCLALNATNGTDTCTSWACDSIVIDSTGMINPTLIWYDCTGAVWGSNTPGTACTTLFGTPGTWAANCQCVADSSTNYTDCLGILNGPNIPGTPCEDGDPATSGELWNANCLCTADTSASGCHACFTTTQVAPFTATFTSCSTGMPAPYTLLWDFTDGGAVTGNPVNHVYAGPGTYGVCLNIQDANGIWCNVCDSVVVAADGTINPVVPQPCHAGFWAIQAYDSTASGTAPIPNEVWVWNLSTGGNGSYQFLWNFGDGTSSTDAYPTHVYSGNGPWLLCLTMTSFNCTDTYCDSVSVDANGILNGLVIDGHGEGTVLSQRSGGFTLNVIQQAPAGIAEFPARAELNLWPNPVDGDLNLGYGTGQAGAGTLSVIDANGRTVLQEEHRFAAGPNTLKIATSELPPGLYVLKIAQGGTNQVKRFLKLR